MIWEENPTIFGNILIWQAVWCQRYGHPRLPFRWETLFSMELWDVMGSLMHGVIDTWVSLLWFLPLWVEFFFKGSLDKLMRFKAPWIWGILHGWQGWFFVWLGMLIFLVAPTQFWTKCLSSVFQGCNKSSLKSPKLSENQDCRFVPYYIFGNNPPQMIPSQI